MLLQGLFVPLTCPFYRDGASYVRKLEHNVARYCLSPVSGLIALAPGSEAMSLTDAEAHETLRAVGETASREKVLLAGVERASVASALALIAEAERANFDAVLLAPPPDWLRLVRGHDARALLSFYEVVADRSPLPMVLWSDARPPALELPIEVVTSLAQHRNILGMVDAALTESRLLQIQEGTSEIRREVTVTTIFEAVTRRMLQAVAEPVAASGFVALETLSGGGGTGSALAVPPTSVVPSLKTRTKVVGFQVLSANSASGMVPLLSGGASGASPEVAACVPQASFEAYAAWKDADLPLAAERASRLQGIEALVQRLGPAAVKAGCDLNGYYGGPPRQPRLPLIAGDRTAVEKSLASIRN